MEGFLDNLNYDLIIQVKILDYIETPKPNYTSYSKIEVIKKFKSESKDTFYFKNGDGANCMIGIGSEKGKEFIIKANLASSLNLWDLDRFKFTNGKPEFKPTSQDSSFVNQINKHRQIESTSCDITRLEINTEFVQGDITKKKCKRKWKIYSLLYKLKYDWAIYFRRHSLTNEQCVQKMKHKKFIRKLMKKLS